MTKLISLAHSSVLVTTCALFLTACGAESNHVSEQPAASQTQNVKTYRVAVQPDLPPFIQQSNNQNNQNFVGLDVDILNEIAKREGFQLEYQPRVWATIFDLLPTNNYDIIASGAVINEDRKTKANFTEPYEKVTTTLIVKQDSNIKTFADIRGKKVASASGGAMESVLQKWHGSGNEDKIIYPSSSWLRAKSVITGESEVAIGSSLTFEYYAKLYKDQNLRVIYQEPAEWSNVAFAVNKNNPELLDKLNKGLASMKADGTFNQIVNKWKNVQVQNNK